MGQTLLDVGSDLQVADQLARIILALGIPDRVVVLDDAQPDPCRMYFLTHVVVSYYPSSPATCNVMWQWRLMMRSARRLPPGRRRTADLPVLVAAEEGREE